MGLPRNSSRGDWLVERIHRFIHRHRLIRTGDLILAGVSGGPDSLFLLVVLSRLLPALGARLHAIHLDHGLRGAESEADAEFVSRTTSCLNVPCTVERRPVPKVAADGASLQERARSIRLAFFREQLKLLHGASVALGHTADDQTETMLLRFIKGGGPGALAGIRPRGPGGIIHPLLEVTRQEILLFLEAEGMSYRTDSSNRRQVYLRNRLRNDVIPRMVDINPALHRRAGEVAAMLREEDDFLNGQALDAYQAARRCRREEVILATARLAALHPAMCRRVVVMAALDAGVRRKDLRARHVDAILKLVSGRMGASRCLPGNRLVLMTPEGLAMLPRRKPAGALLEREVSLPGETPLPELGLLLLAEAAPPRPSCLGGDPMAALVDADALDGRLLVRTRRPGDRFVPLGLGHHQKLQDFLVNRKIQRRLRDAVPVVCDDVKIVWVGGLRLDHRARITQKTLRAWRLRLVPLVETGHA